MKCSYYALVSQSFKSCVAAPPRVGTVAASLHWGTHSDAGPHALLAHGEGIAHVWDSLCPTRFNRSSNVHAFKPCAAVSSTDVGMRPSLDTTWDENELVEFPSLKEKKKTNHKRGLTGIDPEPASNVRLGEKLPRLDCRWSSKFYGQVTFGPRGFAYPSSRWLARRFRMKKHKILKRFRFRRYKLAAVANLPFAKMIRVGMLPELKSSKTRKGDEVDAGLSSQLVTQARTSVGGKVKGRRSRPKSKYQV